MTLAFCIGISRQLLRMRRCILLSKRDSSAVQSNTSLVSTTAKRHREERSGCTEHSVFSLLSSFFFFHSFYFSAFSFSFFFPSKWTSFVARGFGIDESNHSFSKQWSWREILLIIARSLFIFLFLFWFLFWSFYGASVHWRRVSSLSTVAVSWVFALAVILGAWLACLQ